MKRRNYYWHHPGYYLLVFIGILFYVLVVVFVRKSVRVAPGLCDVHTRRRRAIIIGAWVAALLGFTMMLNVDTLGGGAIGLGLQAVLGGLIVGLVGGRTLYAAEIGDRLVRLRGAGKAFLASLPSHPGRR